MPRKHGSYASVREAILDVAAGLFLARGVDAVSLQDIAAAARLSKGTLYYYYPTKESLVLELAHANTERITDAIFSWVDSLARGDAVQDALTQLVETLCTDGCFSGLHIVLLSHAAMGNAELRRLFAASYREWTVMFEVGILKMQPQDAAQIRMKSGMLFTMLSGCALQNQSGVGGQDAAALVDFFMR